MLNLLSVGASYGALTLIFQHGWLHKQLGFETPGFVTSWLPLFLFVILFGLSMDYHVYILSRVREGFLKGMSTDDAVAHGIKQTAGVVTSAAFVMVGVFAIFGTLTIIDYKMLGVGLGFAIFLDATLVRAVLLPATHEAPGRPQLVPAELARVAPHASTTRATSTSRSREPRPGLGLGPVPEPAGAPSLLQPTTPTGPQRPASRRAVVVCAPPGPTLRSLRAPPHGDDLSPDDACCSCGPKARSCRMGRCGCARGRPPGVGLASAHADCPCPRAPSAAPATSRRRSAPASCPPARSWRRTPGGCTTASRAPTRWPATASPMRWRRPRRPTSGSPRPARRRAAAVPRRAVHDQGVDHAARDAQLRGHGGAARPALGDDRAGGAAADRRRLHPARGDQHVGADDVDRVRQPRLRPDPQRL